jgi:hypothetical protein
MQNASPTATRPLEYVAFFCLQVRTQEGVGHVFMAVDAYLDRAFSLGVERDKNPESVLKNIYHLTEHPDFTQYLGNGFTLVLEEFEEISPRINAIISPLGGRLLFNKSYNNVIANPVIIHLLESMRKT